MHLGNDGRIPWDVGPVDWGRSPRKKLDIYYLSVTIRILQNVVLAFYCDPQ